MEASSSNQLTIGSLNKKAELGGRTNFPLSKKYTFYDNK